MKRLVALALLAAPALAAASDRPIGVQSSFRIGSGGSVLCTAESTDRDPALSDMFDRGYAVVCRDAAAPIGHLYALRLRGGDPETRLADRRAAKCAAAARTSIEGLGQVEVRTCTAPSGIPYRTYSQRRGGTFYAAEGLAGYDAALRLGLRTLIADRAVPGDVDIATTEAGDPAAFARVQAGALDPGRAMVEAYRRNNAGAYAEAAEFFDVLIAVQAGATGRGEAYVNQAIQQSNLGAYGEADRLFALAAQTGADDPVVTRMLRNYRTIDLLNRQRPGDALSELDKPLPAGASILPRPNGASVDGRTAARLNAQSPDVRRLDAAGSALLPEERAQILDAQAKHLRGTLLRLAARPAEARTALESAAAELDAVREGRVVSTRWMRAQILGELAALSESAGNLPEAEARHGEAITLLETAYPRSAALLGAQARLAAFQARTGRTAEARTLYRKIVDANAAGIAPSPSLRLTLAPYFALLAAEDGAPAAAEMFKASQLLVRPGVAQTQAVLARELSGGSDEAARLFRQSVNLGREIERLRVETARLAAPDTATPADPAAVAEARARLQQLEQQQVATQAKLADFPRYRVLSPGLMELAELQQALRPGEAYYKMAVLADGAYAILATAETARLWRIGASPAALEKQVDALRATISVEEEGRILTFPFDLALAHRLYDELLGPAGAELEAVRHLIFEPDGALLRLPPNLLVMDRAGVDAYRARAAKAGGDPFDFTGVAWLGRDRDLSTAVSARAFRDVRRAAPSRAAKAYLGFGENQPPAPAATRRAALAGLLGEGASCAWPLAQWAKPISSDELYAARRMLGAGGAGEEDIVTGAAFSDSAIKARGDLAHYRIIHFATHGLVTAPRPECPARPALMTSFGAADSDGLLSFSEIYDLHLDADLIVLSACDTAGKASLAATREAGLRGGGDFALDGLVRAFVGAGGRSIIASHWPVPDDYDATKRLISGIFAAPPGTSVGGALRRAERALMDAPATSHPYYWSGFAIIGDGAAPVRPRS